VNYLRAENIAKHYGDRTLFEGITLSIEEGQKIALVAKNGTGKTNLLNIIAGTDTTDGGSVVVSKDIISAYLEQQPHMPKGINVWDHLFNANSELLNVVAEYEQLLLHQSDDENYLNRLQHCMEEMDRLNAWDYEVRVKQILEKLNITQYNQDVSTLSGGQQKRLALARILIMQPDFVIMDEPTNHLDLDMIEWLEGYLKSSKMTLLIVTHDRYFLDNVCNEIIELERGQLYFYKGNYPYYLEKKADREFREGREADKARNLMKKELEWMRKQPKARGTKSKSRIEAFYDLQEKAKYVADDKQVELDVKMQRLGSKIIEFHGLCKTYRQEERTIQVLQNFSYIFKPGERIGIIGKNGVGKSTFLNIIQGIEKADAGVISTGDTVKFGYYSQAGIDIKEDKRVLEVVKDIAEYIELSKGEQLSASQLCKRFLFDDKMQHTFVSKLSGGEKRRLFLLTVLIKNPNFLILDEPTNDLDIDTLNVLEEFLESFKGCLLIVTHDRYFMDKLVDHLFLFEGSGVVRDFNGNYQDYLNEEKLPAEPVAKPTIVKESLEKEKTQAESNRKKPTFNEKREYDQLTNDIEVMESDKIAIEKKLSVPDLHFEEIQKLAATLQQINHDIDLKSIRWLELNEFCE
jgi:ABC transport system ATP-binding/permease protein